MGHRIVFIAFALTSVLFAQAPKSGKRAAPEATKSPVRSVPQARPAPIALGIPLFHQTVGTPETEALGAGITDSLANALKGSPSLTVAGPDVLTPASKRENLDPGTSDADALRLANQLGLVMLVLGSYQQIGSQLIVDARILNTQTGTALPGASISVSAKYPDEYAMLLAQLATRAFGVLKLPTTRAQTQGVNAAVMPSASSDALRLYNQGLQRLAEGTPQSLQAAIALFADCLKIDPSYALAYAAKAEAENRLVDSTKASGGTAPDIAQAAVKDAEQAVKSQPNLARGQTALASAYAASGEYDQALRAAQRAIALSPNDSAAHFAQARAKNKGELLPSKDLTDLMIRQPWMQYVFFYLPKVIIRNQSKFKLVVTFAPISGEDYPTLNIQPESSKAMTLFAGQFNVSLDSDAGILKREYDFKGGEQYELTYRAEEIPVTHITATNDGNTPAYVTFDGPKKREFVINPGAQESFNVQAGQYTIRCAGTTSGPSLQERQDNLRPGAEYRYVCSVRRTSPLGHDNLKDTSDFQE
jgi:tetratricopeptide (TPR) repeat protein